MYGQVATAVAAWDLGYIVITSVDRDDVPDQVVVLTS